MIYILFARAISALLVLVPIAGLAFGSTGAAEAAAWYVDGLKGGRANSGSAASPYLYLWQALQVVQPGDTIYVVPSMVYSQLGFTANGTAAKPITLAGSDPAHKTQVSGGGVNSALWVNGNYVVATGFDVTAPGAFPGVSIAPNHHHVTIAGNAVHDCGANGINVVADDYVTLSHNVVSGNARDTSNGHHGSGISILASVDIDTNTGAKMVIDGNFVYSNTNTPNCTTPACLATASDSDGSGIILDDNQRKRFDHVAYRGGFRITNNVVYRNGGRGIHVFQSDNATIANNTAGYNNQDYYEGFWHPGEIAVLYSGNVQVYDNLLYSDGLASHIHGGTAPNTHVVIVLTSNTDGTGPIVAEHNLGYNPQKDPKLFFYLTKNTEPVITSGNLFGGPRLENPVLGDFRFRPGSPAFGSADPATATATDVLGVRRAPRPSIGAYQNPGP